MNKPKPIPKLIIYLTICICFLLCLSCATQELAIDISTDPAWKDAQLLEIPISDEADLENLRHLVVPSTSKIDCEKLRIGIGSRKKAKYINQQGQKKQRPVLEIITYYDKDWHNPKYYQAYLGQEMIVEEYTIKLMAVVDEPFFSWNEHKFTVHLAVKTSSPPLNKCPLIWRW